MSLTGHALLWLVVLGTCLAFAAAVLVQPRLAGRGLRPVLGRISSMLLVNALVIVTVLVAANDRYSFFADWADVRGALLGASTTGSGIQAGGPPAATPIGNPTSSPSPRRPGRSRLFQVSGDGLRGAVMVTVPPGYDDPRNQQRRYPVLETFHGYPGTPAQWNHSMAIRKQLDAAAGHHLLADVVTISPTWEFPPGVDTECVDGGTRVEDWLTQIVPAWAERTLRVLPSRRSWATIGLSAGGWCAAMSTMLHPGRYVAGIVLGGYFAPQFGHGYVPFRPGSAQARRYDLVTLAGRRPPPVELWVETSRADTLSYPSTARLVRAVRSPMSVRVLTLRHAGHRLSVWAAALPAALAWLGRLPGFAPS